MARRKKTTEAEFEEFKRGFTATQDLLGLKDWGVDFELGGTPKGTEAENDWDFPEHCTLVRLTATHPSDFKPFEAGVHEALHLMLAALSHYALARFTTEDDINEADEGIVRRLEPVIVGVLRAAENK